MTETRQVLLDAVLKMPNGQACTEPEVNEKGVQIGQVDLTLKNFLYRVLLVMQKDEKLTLDRSLKLAVLAQRVSEGGMLAFTVDEIKMILDRLTGYAPAAIYGVVSLLDPEQIARLGGTPISETVN